jgi:hypothetical protein
VRRARRDAVLAVRTPWRESLALALTVLIGVSIPLGAWAAAEAGDQMATVEDAAVTLEELGPQAAAIGATLADVTRELTVLAAEYRPLITDVGDGVATVTARLDEVAADLEPITSTLGVLGALLAGGDSTSAIGDSLTDAQAAVDAVLGSFDDVAAVSADVAEQIDLLTSPETLATVRAAADAVDSIAALSARAGELADGYTDHADTIAAIARLVAVGSVVASAIWLAWRIREHRRWQDLRRRGVGDAVIATIHSATA